MATTTEEASASTARVQVVNEVQIEHGDEGWKLCFQWCRYIYGNGHMQHGYRFIWRRPDGSLQAARGQARIPSIAAAQDLMDRAEKAGWGEGDGK